MGGKIVDVQDIISSVNKLTSELSEKFCIISGNIEPLEKIEQMGYEEFSLMAKEKMPLKLYKYFPNKWEEQNNSTVNYSLIALENNTVYLQSPNLFDDIYDSSMHIEWNEFVYFRLQEYCRRCGCALNSKAKIEDMVYLLSSVLLVYYDSKRDICDAFNGESVLERLSNQVFAKTILWFLNKTKDWGTAIINSLQEEYSEYVEKLQQIFRVTCFATTPFSQLMWGGSYADCHRGFCIEYTIKATTDDLTRLYLNFFPMIYCSVRPNITKEMIKVKDIEISEETLWNIYFHGALRKSIDWAYQDEWRLLLPFNKTISDFNVPFFPISKVYLGNRMDRKNREIIIDICKRKRIPYIGVMKDNDKFRMKECNILCEECSKFKSTNKF